MAGIAPKVKFIVYQCPTRIGSRKSDTIVFIDKLLKEKPIDLSQGRNLTVLEFDGIQDASISSLMGSYEPTGAIKESTVPLLLALYAN
jgi:hypothetical protein